MKKVSRITATRTEIPLAKPYKLSRVCGAKVNTDNISAGIVSLPAGAGLGVASDGDKPARIGIDTGIVA
jgi:hypothetical protein